MKTKFEPLVLESLRELFRNEESYVLFTQKLMECLHAGISPLVAGGEIVGLAVSNENGKELIFQNVTKRWIANPSFLDQLRRSIESEELVSAPELNESIDKLAGRSRQSIAPEQ